MPLEFNKHQHPLLISVDMWGAQTSLFTFIVLRDKKPGSLYFTSYKDIRRRSDSHPISVMFGLNGVDRTDLRMGEALEPKDGWPTLEQAQEACRVKYKQLLAKR